MIGDSWYYVSGSNYVGDINVSSDWEFECDLWLGDNWWFGTIARLTITNGNYGTYGDEILNLDVTSWNELFVASDTFDYPDIYEWTAPQAAWSELHLKIRREGSVRQVWINGETVLYLDWLGETGAHDGVQAWVGDSFETPADAALKNVKWTNLNSDVTPGEGDGGSSGYGVQLVSNDWLYPEFNNYWGTIDLLPRDFVFEFDF